MPPGARIPSPVVLVFGDDEFTVKQRSKEIYQAWCADLGGMDHEVIDASVANSGEALKALAKLREALQTLPFFGGGKAVWLQNCNFLGDERTATARDVTENLASLSQELKTFPWQNVRLLISAGKVDKRKTFFKTLEKIGTVEAHAGLSADDKDWAQQAEQHALRLCRELNKSISEDALSELVANVGPNVRLLHGEIEKLTLYAADRDAINVEDVKAIVTQTKQARAFALADAIGERNIPRAMKRLDEELWETKLDSARSEIGLLYGIITKIRAMIFLKELVESGMLKTVSDYNRFKSQLERIPADSLPEDKRFNPLSMNPYVLFKAAQQVRNYSLAELIRAMELLLDCNQKMISSGDPAMALQRALIEIMSRSQKTASAAESRPA